MSVRMAGSWLARRGLALSVGLTVCATFAEAMDATPTSPRATAAQGSPLTGTVSGLSGDVRGLQGLVSALGGEIREREILVELPADVLFTFDRSDLQPAAEPTLRTLGELIGKTTGVAKVNGHTDAKGDDEYNLTLSTRRAEAVVAWLTAHGVDPKRLVATGLGEQRPVAPNTMPDGRDDPAGRAKNRRVEVVIPR